MGRALPMTEADLLAVMDGYSSEELQAFARIANTRAEAKREEEQLALEPGVTDPDVVGALRLRWQGLVAKIREMTDRVSTSKMVLRIEIVPTAKTPGLADLLATGDKQEMLTNFADDFEATVTLENTEGRKLTRDEQNLQSGLADTIQDYINDGNLEVTPGVSSSSDAAALWTSLENLGQDLNEVEGGENYDWDDWEALLLHDKAPNIRRRTKRSRGY